MQTIDTTDFQIVLQKLGFSHWKMPIDWLESEPSDCEVETWNKTILTNKGSRKISVQLWSDGKHRVSHMLDGRETTSPGGFSNPWRMIEAIMNEVTRTDHSPI